MKLTMDELMKNYDEQRPTLDQAYLDGNFPGWKSVGQRGIACFTGWKGTYKAGSGANLGPEYTMEIEDGEQPGYVGQWFYWTAEGRSLIYVNLPGMETGTVQPGASFALGEMRVDPNTPASELNDLISKGHARLMELVQVPA